MNQTVENHRITQTEQWTVEVEADLFSGRPNPAWRLTAAEACELMTLLAALPVRPRSTVPDSGLGYRGLRVRCLPQTGVRSRLRLVIAGGAIIREGDGGEIADILTDNCRKLEHWLLGTAEGRVEAGIGAYLRQLSSGS